jgi:ArsR family transcriptional regulator
VPDESAHISAPASTCCPPITTAALSEEAAEIMARMFKALSDPVRLRLLSRVASHPAGEACVCDIADVGVSQPTVSHHLKKLREAGLLTSDRRATWVYYRLAPGALAALGAFLTETGLARIDEKVFGAQSA